MMTAPEDLPSAKVREVGLRGIAISKETAKKNIDVLINYLNGKVEELIFKHALIQARC